ncbi:hypothetical protein [Sorangium sp. So ce233]|uniref:hypothetical protein n=1 Tax=Sorangium sp. So ce233 TaxID=3133290 RepID=UPI003F60331D
MTLRATLAERLGLESAADADARERGDYWHIERPSLLRQSMVIETPVERALRRSGAPVGCGLRRLLPDPGDAECQAIWRLRWKLRGYCAQGTPAGHTLVTAPALRAMRSGRTTCAGRT